MLDRASLAQQERRIGAKVIDEADLSADQRLTVTALLREALSQDRIWCAAVRPLFDAFLRAHPESHRETAQVYGAYVVAEWWHRGVWRKSGAPYITHPLSVATILAELGVDTATVQAALLHDTVEDTAYTLEEMRVDFGIEVAGIVDGVTKLDGKRLGTDRAGAERATYHKLVLSAGADLRVLLIKLADRLHNLRTLGAQPPHKQHRIAQQTLDLLVPFAARIGMYRLKRELEDLCLRYLQPEVEARLRATLEATTPTREAFYARVLSVLRPALRDSAGVAELTVRPRHVYSLARAGWDGTTTIPPGRLCRIVVVVAGHERECWLALGAVHSVFPPVAGQVRDYIAAPKHNFYRSLHTTVIGPDDEQVDVLIRTDEMAAEAEDGIAASLRAATHTAGHEAAGQQAQRRTDFAWLQRLLAWHDDTSEAAAGGLSEDYLTELRNDLQAGSTVVVSVTDGRLVTLPSGATGIDFAFDRSVAVGSRLVGLQVNGRPTTVTATLNTGDRVEALTGPPGEVPPRWADHVHSPQARKALAALLELQQPGSL